MGCLFCFYSVFFVDKKVQRVATAASHWCHSVGHSVVVDNAHSDFSVRRAFPLVVLVKQLAPLKVVVQSKLQYLRMVVEVHIDSVVWLLWVTCPSSRLDCVL